jgi:hypothetical protein
MVWRELQLDWAHEQTTRESEPGHGPPPPTIPPSTEFGIWSSGHLVIWLSGYLVIDWGIGRFNPSINDQMTR